MSHMIDQVGPVLRGLFAESGRLPHVTFTDQKPAQKSLKVALADDAAPDTIVNTLRKVVDRADETTRAITVEGLGSFIVQPIDASLTGRAAGKVAVVTGAAQGFGLEIAQDLAGEGAAVVLADLNAAGAQEAARELNREIGAERARGLAVNVTDGASIAAAVSEVVRAFGGVDVFISNAGVLKAESVKTQSEKDFDFVSAVNYKGYFLCVQNIAPVLALQHRACPDYRSDIIQINSKSGLEGSNRNGAYAGSKFGGIGLTQSFALELVEDGVKVNSICPGNFFDGPLWSNPDNGLFVQYLRTHKVPGAKTLEDVRRFYEAKVPMGRGCTTPDVMKAVYYLMEQQYETGQAVPVTGGQVMLH
jgi:sorbitol-6-phosphate 2-dehydrogenase